jgi:hypothetical protein
MKKFIFFSFYMTLMTAFFVSCDKSNSQQEPSKGSINLLIEHTMNGFPVEFDKLIYENEAGNQFLLTEIQWFISDIKLHKSDGTYLLIGDDGGEYYIDTDIPASFSIKPDFDITADDYTGLSFTFGINDVKNKSHRFVNPPESFMFWPNYLGGGYHYMKLNGKWLNSSGLAEPFNFHLGIGQIYDTIAPKSKWTDMSVCCKSDHCEGYSPDNQTMPVTGFIQNFFEVEFPQTPIIISAGKTTEVRLEMKVENWFKGPHIYDHNVWGGSIMQQQEAMKLGCENGHDVFTLSPKGIR